MKVILLVIFLILIFDFIWLYSNKNMYNSLVKNIQGSDIKLNFIGAILAYICSVIGLFIFTFPLIKYEYEKNNKQSLLLLSIKYGGLLGFLVFALFNTTNIAIFKNYNYKIALIDTLWSFFSYSLITYIAIYLYLKN